MVSRLISRIGRASSRRNPIERRDHWYRAGNLARKIARNLERLANVGCAISNFLTFPIAIGFPTPLNNRCISRECELVANNENVGTELLIHRDPQGIHSVESHGQLHSVSPARPFDTGFLSAEKTARTRTLKRGIAALSLFSAARTAVCVCV